MPNTWFTSDTHFFHANILKYCDRPYPSVEEMNQALIDNWNSCVKMDDHIWHLGDFSFGNLKQTMELFEQLKGNIHIVKGNHDRTQHLTYAKNIEYLESLDEYARTIKVEGQEILLCHYAHRVWNKSHWGVWHLYGHSHGNLPDDPHALSMDVGVDAHNYFPISFEEVKVHMDKKDFQPVDHHGRDR